MKQSENFTQRVKFSDHIECNQSLSLRLFLSQGEIGPWAGRGGGGTATTTAASLQQFLRRDNVLGERHHRLPLATTTSFASLLPRAIPAKTWIQNTYADIRATHLGKRTGALHARSTTRKDKTFARSACHSIEAVELFHRVQDGSNTGESSAKILYTVF